MHSISSQMTKETKGLLLHSMKVTFQLENLKTVDLENNCQYKLPDINLITHPYLSFGELFKTSIKKNTYDIMDLQLHLKYGHLKSVRIM